MPEAPQFLTVKEVAYQLRTSPQNLYFYLKKGSGPPFFRIGNEIRIPLDTFKEWLRNGGSHKTLTWVDRRDSRKGSRRERKQSCTA
jgi:excisionase family DNA binding protein